MDELILITGATGKVGRRALSLVEEKGLAVRAGSRAGDPRFDWTDESTWGPVLEGVTKIFLVPHDGARLTRPFVRRAAAAGVTRVVLLSGRGVDVPGYVKEDSLAGLTHGDGEDAVRASGLEWTIIRPGWFAQNFSEGFFRDAVMAGELRLPGGDGAASFVDADDIAAVAVAALTESAHVGQTYELSGPRAVTFGEAAELIAKATGRPLRYVPLGHEEFVAELVANGWPGRDAEDYADAVSPVRRGIDAYLSDGVRRALGREPLDFEGFVERAAAAGAWNAG